MNLNPKKCEVLKESFKYLGRIVAKVGVRLNPVQAIRIRALKIPRNRNQSNFLGLAKYYHDCFTNYASQAESLTELTKANETL